RRLLSAHAEGRRVIVIVDEAQNLSAEVLEQVRLLTNLETATQKLLQIILIGQPELRELLDRTDLRQLAQRITGRYHLRPLSREETLQYVRHRLRVAGASGEIFTSAALREVHRLSSGIPRVINVCCDRALLGAYTQEERKLGPGLVRRAAGEVYGRRFSPRWLRWAAGTLLLAGAAAAAFAGFGFWQRQFSELREAVKAASGAAHSPPAIDAHPAAAPPAAAPAAPAAASPPPVSINALLAANEADTGDAAAFRRLLSLWGTAMVEDRDPCGQAQKAGLACLEQHGAWAQVRALNRPAILTLTDEKGQRHRVVLSALDDQFATLDLGEHSVRVPLDELSRDWFGEFTVVWKPKTNHTHPLSVGMRGDDVRWLRRSLNALQGAAADPERGDIYDEELATAVQNFQREHRLNVDGIAGLQTQVVLDTALAEPGSPLLMKDAPRG
ncbi:MAG: AAA family ATPase, partial [Steroidobacteraceae bacterium]